MVSVPLGRGAYRRTYGREPPVELVNRFFEEDPTNLEGGVALLSRPGTRLIKEIGTGPIRRVWSQRGTYENALFVVSGSAFFRLNTDLTLEQITGTVAGDGSPEIAATRDIVFIADGSTLQYYSGPGTRATGVLTFTGNAANNETVTIGTQVYTFKTSLTAPSSSDEVLIGADENETIANLVAAINNGDGAGTLYGASTAINLDVTAAEGVGATMDVTAKLSGLSGNSVATTETVANASWGGATLSGAVSGFATGTLTLAANANDGETVTVGSTTYTWRAAISAANDVQIGASETASCVNLAAAINRGAGEGTTYGTGTVANPEATAVASTNTVVVTARAAGVGGNSITTTETMVDGSWSAATLTGGVNASLAQIAVPDNQAVVSIGIVSGFVIVVLANSQRWYYIEPGALVINPLSFYTAESGTDELINVVVVGDQAWLFGEATTEVWYVDAASPDDPFSRVQQRVFARGVVEGTPVLLNEDVLLVGDDGVVYSVGAGITRISDHSVEESIRLALKAQRDNA